MAGFGKVMLIDDDEMMLLICERLMKISGFTNNVITFPKAQPAKDYLSQTQTAQSQLPDIIFVDLMLDYYKKWDFLDWFKIWAGNNKLEIPLYVMSSSINDEDREGALEYAFVKDFIVKPLTQDHFVKIKAADNA